MADKAAAAGAAKPVWMKQAEEAKVKIEAEKDAAAKAAFDATFKSADQAIVAAGDKTPIPDTNNDSSDSDDDDDEEDYLARKPIGPVDPSKCAAQGAGIAGGAACTPCTFVVVTKDADGRKLVTGGAEIKVKISPAAGVTVNDQEGIVKDMCDGSYGVTYVVPQRGNYMVHVDCNGKPIMGSPYPVFFSAGSPAGAQVGVTTATPYSNLVNQTMPNMPNYSGALGTAGAPSGVVSGASATGWLGTMPGMAIGPSGGVILPGIGASLGEVCREFLNGRCSNSACKLNHPAQNLLATAVSAMGSMSQVPMAPAAAAIAAATAIRAAQQMQKDAQAKIELSDKVGKVDALKRTLQISNLNPLLTAEQLKQLFSYCGTVVDCIISDSKHSAYVEYSKVEEATAALALNNMDFGGRPLNVEMAKTLPAKPSPDSANLVMQQTIAMQTLQFQHALLMQQSMISQQAAKKAATMKSALEIASSRAAEISMKLKAEGKVSENIETPQKSSSPSPVRKRSKSRSKSPITRRSRRSRSLSFSRYQRELRLRSPARSRHYRTDRVGSYRDSRDNYSRGGDRYSREGRRERERSSDRHVRRGRSRSRSRSPKTRKSYRVDSQSPRRRRVSRSPAERKVYRAGSRSPTHYGSGRSSRRHERRSRSPYMLDRKGESYTRGSGEAKVRSHRRSRSKSADKKRSRSKSSERRHHSKKDGSRDKKRSRSERLDITHPADGTENEGKKSSQPKYPANKIKTSGEDAARTNSKARSSVRPRSPGEDGLPEDSGNYGVTVNREKQYNTRSHVDSSKERDKHLGSRDINQSSLDHSDNSHSDYSDDDAGRNTRRKERLNAVTKSMEKSCNIGEELLESKTEYRGDGNKHKKAACSDDDDYERHYDAKSFSRDSAHDESLSNSGQDINMSNEVAHP